MAAARTSLLAGGTNLGGFTVVRELGVRRVPTYAAQRRNDKAELELAVLERVTRDGDAGAAAALGRVAKIVASLSHPNVARVRGVEEMAGGSRDGDVLVVSDFVDAERYDVVAAAANKAGRPLKLVLHLRVLVDVLGGLSAIHLLRDAKGAPARLFHGEVSPANVLLATDGSAKIAHACRPRGGRNAPEAIGYVAPEIRLGDNDAQSGPRSDVYSCGVMLWEALAGKRLFPGDHDARILPRQLQDKLEAALPQADLAWAAPLSDVALRALAADPEKRYATTAEMAAEVRKVAGARLALKSALAAAVKDLAGERIAERRRGLLTPSPSAPMRRPAMMPTPGMSIPSDVLARALVDALPTARATIPEAAPARDARPAQADAIGADMLLHATVGAPLSRAPASIPKVPSLPVAKPATLPLPASGTMKTAARASADAYGMDETTRRAPPGVMPDAARRKSAPSIDPHTRPTRPDDDEVTAITPGLFPQSARALAIASTAEPAIELAVDLRRGTATPPAMVAPVMARRPSFPEPREIGKGAGDITARTDRGQARSRKIVLAILGAMILLLMVAGIRVATRTPEGDDMPSLAATSAGASTGTSAGASDPPVAVTKPEVSATPTATNTAVPEPTAAPRMPAGDGRAASTASAGTGAGMGTGARATKGKAKPKVQYDPLGI